MTTRWALLVPLALGLGRPAAGQSWQEAELCGSAGHVSMLKYVAGAMWVGTDTALLEFRDGVCTRHGKMRFMHDLAGTATELWAINESELWLWRDQRWRQYQGTSSMSLGGERGHPCYQPFGAVPELATPEMWDGVPYVHPHLGAVGVDGLGGLWIAYYTPTSFGSVVRFDGEALECWDAPEVQVDISDLAVADDAVYLLSLDWPRRVFVYSDGSWASMRAPDTIYRIYYGHRRLWGVGSEGVHSYDGEVWTGLDPSPVELWAMALGSHGDVWAMAYPTPLLRQYSAAGVKEYAAPIDSGRMARVAVDGDDRIWVARGAEVFILDPQAGTSVHGASWGQMKGGREAP